MRVICVVPEYPSDVPSRGVGGITTYFLNMAMGYADSGAEVTVLTSAINSRLGGVTVGSSGEEVIRAFRHPSQYSSGILGRLRFEVGRELRLAWYGLKFRHDTVVLELPDWQTPVLIGMIVGRQRTYMKLHGPSDFIRIINNEPSGRLQRLLDRRERFWARNVQLLESGSSVLTRHVREAWGLTRKVEETPDPFSLSSVSFEDTVAPETFKKGEDEMVIVNVGRLEFRKGQHVVCEAVTRISELSGNWRVHFVGPDTDTAPGETSYRAYCETLLPDHSRRRVEWHGPLPTSALTALYDQADIVLVSSLDGNYGYTTLHPLAAAACVITTLEPGQTRSQYVDHGLNGLLYPSTDVAALAALLGGAISDAALRQRLRGGAAARAQVTLDPARHASRVLALFGLSGGRSGDRTPAH